MLRAFCISAPGFINLLPAFLPVNSSEQHVLDRYDQAAPQSVAALTACAELAVFSVSPRQISACGARGAGHACVDCADVGHQHSPRRMVVGDLAGGDRRLATSRQYSQESSGARGWYAAWRVARSRADPAAVDDPFDHGHVRAPGSDCRGL